MNYFERNAAAHAANGQAKAARRSQRGDADAARIQLWRDTMAANNAKLQCPHCHVTGQVTAHGRRDKKGISGGKATAAFLTFGVSLLFVGLSRREDHVHLYCRNCGMTWAA
jgi:regulator of protease activity HflC (stomatin/prohibitin superfamily)